MKSLRDWQDELDYWIERRDSLYTQFSLSEQMVKRLLQERPTIRNEVNYIETEI